MLGFAPLASIPIADDDQSPPVVYTGSATVTGVADVSITITKLNQPTGTVSGVASVIAGEVKVWPITATVTGTATIDSVSAVKVIEPYLPILGVGSTEISVSKTSTGAATVTGTASVTAGEIFDYAIGFDPPEILTGTATVALDILTFSPQKIITPALTIAGAATVSCAHERLAEPTATVTGVGSIQIGFPVPVEKQIDLNLSITGTGSVSISTLHTRPSASATATGSAATDCNATKVYYQALEPTGVATTQVTSVHIVTVTASGTRSNTDSWTNELNSTVNIYESIDEVSYNDADYIKSPGLRNAVGFLTTSSYEFNLNHLVNPLTNDHHKVKFRMRRANEGILNVQVDLYCNATLVKSWTYLDIDTNWIDVEEELDPVLDVPNISNYSNLWVRITGEVPV
jgi:hypothetical protein